MSWIREACTRRIDPDSGSIIVQLTQSAMVSNNIYGETPYCTPDGTRVAVIRRSDYSFQRTASLLVVDLASRQISRVESEIVGGLCTSSWSGILYYWTTDRKLVKYDMTRMAREVIYSESDPAQPLSILNTTSDHKRILYCQGGRAVCCLDLDRGVRRVLAEVDGIGNPHLQARPDNPHELLVQRQVDGATRLCVIDTQRSVVNALAAGDPHTSELTGHECWVGKLGRVLYSTRWNGDPFGDCTPERETSAAPWSHDKRHPGGNLFTVATGDAAPTLLSAPEHKFNHISASSDGKYFVADSYMGDSLLQGSAIRGVAIVIGNLESGRVRVLVTDAQASGGGSQSTHTHPYLTTSNSHVIYNADPGYSVPQVFSASVPREFLASLD